MNLDEPLASFAVELNTLYDGVALSQIDKIEDQRKDAFFKEVIPVCLIAWLTIRNYTATLKEETGIPLYSFDSLEIENLLNAISSNSEVDWNFFQEFNPEGWCALLFESIEFTTIPVILTLRENAAIWIPSLLQATRDYLPIELEDGADSPSDEMVIDALLERLVSGFNSGIESLLVPVKDFLIAICESAKDKDSPTHEESKEYLKDKDKLLDDLREKMIGLSTSLPSLHLLFFGNFQSLIGGEIKDDWQSLVFTNGKPSMRLSNEAKEDFSVKAYKLAAEYADTKRKVCPFARATDEFGEKIIRQFTTWLFYIAENYMAPFIINYYQFQEVNSEAKSQNAATSA